MLLKNKVLLIILLIISQLIILEVALRGYLYLTGKAIVTVISAKDVLKKACFAPHPYLIYVFKPNNSFTMIAYGNHQFTTNKYGFRSTLKYDIKNKTKSVNTVRMVTIGGSTTMGVNNDDEIWPYLVGKYIAEMLPNKNIEVLNEGTMGYTSLDNLIDLEARIIDYECDVYILYLGVNDLLTINTPNYFKTDYSHFRRTLYESLYSSSIQLVPSCLFNSKIFQALLRICGVPNNRDLISNTSTAQFRKEIKLKLEERYQMEDQIRQTVIRNVMSMVGIIRVHRPDAMIVLSSFYDLENREFINKTNHDFYNLSQQLRISFVDAANKIPKERDIAYDYGHFTPKGERLMGKLISDAIIANIQNKVR